MFGTTRNRASVGLRPDEAAALEPPHAQQAQQAQFWYGTDVSIKPYKSETLLTIQAVKHSCRSTLVLECEPQG